MSAQETADLSQAGARRGFTEYRVYQDKETAEIARIALLTSSGAEMATPTCLVVSVHSRSTSTVTPTVT